MRLYRETKGVVTQNAVVLNAGYAFKGFFSLLTLYMYNGSQRMNGPRLLEWKDKKTYVTKRNDTSVRMCLTSIKVGVSCRFGFLFLFSLILVSNDFQSTRVTLFPCVPKLTKSQNSSFWIFNVTKRPKMVNFLIHNKYFSNIQWFILFIFLQTLNKTFLYCVKTSAMFASTDDVVLNKHFNVLISHTQIVFLIALICECAKSMHLIVKEEINKIPLQN